MNKPEIIQKTADHVKELFLSEGTGHDWWHIYRVWKLAEHIAADEEADLFVVELGALLHDIADFKFHGGDDSVGPREARKWLTSLAVDGEIIEKVCHIVENVSFKGAGVENHMQSIEGKIVQDADRLDALGAIGIARAFAYGGSKGRLLYDPDETPVLHASFEEYKKGSVSTLNHFYEKLFLLKDRMNTPRGKALAAARHEYMEKYVQEFMQEWEGMQ